MRSIAIVGMACRYADANTPQQLWENVLAERSAFRRIPPVRLRTADYQGAEDSISCDIAAVVENFEFDRAGYRVSAPTYRSVDLSHWMALQVAGEALRRVPYEALAPQAGVFVGNTLTSEFARANLMRLRWPYVERVLRAAFQQQNCCTDPEPFLASVESLYKLPFPPTSEESLAGGLSNTIAGRICNTFDLHGGGFTLDAACASSLLAVANACSSLEDGSLELALAGGVDLSLDPFELAGFSALGALASESMRVYDSSPTGFWPGEGCGFVALMREEEALARGIPVLARIRGWGISSDGHGGITRPEVAGQLLALRRAYKSAEYGIDTVPYFEGHGTGTAVGDATELGALIQARRHSGSAPIAAAVGSIKTLIGHTKAAAGIAGLIKAVCAIGSQVIPATAGCETPHASLSDAPGLRCPRRAELWPADAPLRAGVSAMGFGGINAHIALEGLSPMRRTRLSALEQTLVRTRQDSEVFPFSASSREHLRQSALRLRAHADGLSFGELSDVSAALAESLHMDHEWRAAVVASSPRELASRLDRLATLLSAESSEQLLSQDGIYWSNRSRPARIGFLFPGQSSPVYRDGGLWARRFPEIDELYHRSSIPVGPNTETRVAQPAIATASLAALRVLNGLKIEADLGLGHSLGDLLALCWAGGITPETLLELAGERGRAMGSAGSQHPGAMLSVAATRAEVESLSHDLGLVIACHNSETQSVVSGPAAAIRKLQVACAKLSIESKLLPVTCAFHSPLMQAAAEDFSGIVRRFKVDAPHRSIVSSVTGLPLGREIDIPRLLETQITAPVEFANALAHANGHVDLWIEAGPGHVLSSLAALLLVPVIPLDAGGSSFSGLCHAVAAAHVLKRAPSFAFWFRDRKLRPFSFDVDRKFLANPCESIAFTAGVKTQQPSFAAVPTSEPTAKAGDHGDCLLLLRHLISRRSELPLETIRAEHRFLTDLHLNSITVTQLITQAASELSIPAPVFPISYSTVTLAEAAAALEELRIRSSHEEPDTAPAANAVAGVDTWARPFTVDWVRKNAPKQRGKFEPGSWQVLSDCGSQPPLVLALKQALEAYSSGLLVYLANPTSELGLALALSAARQAEQGSVTRLLLLQETFGAEAFFRSVFLEHAKLHVTIVTGTVNGSLDVGRLAAEALTNSGFREVMFDERGVRNERRMRALHYPTSRGFPLAPGARLLVTGGGRGIGLECALELARRHHLQLAIMGRSPIDSDSQLERNLERIRASGIEFSYLCADVTDARSVATALRSLQANGLYVNGVLHAAGVNVPERASRLTEETLRASLSPKCDGLRNILAALPMNSLELLVTFGSVIGQTGLDGEAHYALANSRMGSDLALWAGQNPSCHSLQIDWSVWAGAGMGERLGSLDQLVKRGISPISIESGVDGLDRMIQGSQPGFQSVILTGRFGNLPTLTMEERDLPLGRFLESQLVHVPEVELVCETVLSGITDPFLADHEVDGQRLLPAVMGLEAMAQACCALMDGWVLGAIEHIEFVRPVVLPQEDSRRIRIAALAGEPGTVKAVLRSEETGFQIDHFKATYVFQHAAGPVPLAAPAAACDPVPLDPERDLYGTILFHSGRFRRIERYLELAALRCRSVVRTGPADWFGGGMPETLLLGDPGARDAAIHSVQACIPQATLLPVRVGRITIADTAPAARGTRVITASERSHQNGDYVYDLEINDSDGRLIEHWEGLVLRQLAGVANSALHWAPALLVPYLEWAAMEFHVPVKAAIRASAEEKRNDRRQAIAETLAGPEANLRTRLDGKPETDNGTISFTHMDPFTLGVHAAGCVSCDLVEIQKIQPGEWRALLGETLYSLASLVSQEANEPIAHASARVWAAFECLRKTDADPGRRLTLLPEQSGEWMCFGAGTKRVMAGVRFISGIAGPVAVALLVDQQTYSVASVA